MEMKNLYHTGNNSKSKLNEFNLGKIKPKLKLANDKPSITLFHVNEPYLVKARDVENAKVLTIAMIVLSL